MEKERLIEALKNGQFRDVDAQYQRYWKRHKSNFAALMKGPSLFGEHETLWEETIDRISEKVKDDSTSSIYAKEMIDSLEESGVLGNGIVKNIFSLEKPAWLKILDNKKVDDKVLPHLLKKISKAEILLLERMGECLIERLLLPKGLSKGDYCYREKSLDCLVEKGATLLRGDKTFENLDKIFSKFEGLGDQVSPKKWDFVKIINQEMNLWEIKSQPQKDFLKKLFFLRLKHLENQMDSDNCACLKSSFLKLTFYLEEKKLIAQKMIRFEGHGSNIFDQVGADFIQEEEVKKFIKDLPQEDFGRFGFNFFMQAYLSDKEKSAKDFIKLSQILERLSTGYRSTFIKESEKKLIDSINPSMLFEEVSPGETFISHILEWQNLFPGFLDEVSFKIFSLDFLKHDLGIDLPKKQHLDEVFIKMLPEQKGLIKTLIREALFKEEDGQVVANLEHKIFHEAIVMESKSSWIGHIDSFLKCGEEFIDQNQRLALLDGIFSVIEMHKSVSVSDLEKIQLLIDQIEDKSRIDWGRNFDILNPIIESDYFVGDFQKAKELALFMEKQLLLESTPPVKNPESTKRPFKI